MSKGWLRIAHRIGFAGIGTMGSWMARNLLNSGFPVTVLDKDARAVANLTKFGAAQTSNPAQMALASGLGSEDKWAMIKVFEQLLEVEFRRGEGSVGGSPDEEA